MAANDRFGVVCGWSGFRHLRRIAGSPLMNSAALVLGDRNEGGKLPTACEALGHRHARFLTILGFFLLPLLPPSFILRLEKKLRDH